MRRLSLAGAGLALGALALSSLSCAGLGAPVARSARRDGGPRMFWTLLPPEGSGKGVLHVQGTLHLGKDELYPLDDTVRAAMASSDAVLAELSEAELARAQGLILERMAASGVSEAQSLYRVLPDADVAWAEDFMGKETFRRLSGFQPWVAYSVIDVFAAAKAGLDPGLSVDAALYAMARELGKPVEGLETADFQLAVLTGPSMPMQRLLLGDSIREYRDEPDAVERLYEAYRADRRAEFERAVMESMARSERFAPELADFNDSILASRNASWAGRLAGLLAEGKTVFVFAGAAHFIGPDNVVDLLLAQGYTLAP